MKNFVFFFILLLGMMFLCPVVQADLNDGNSDSEILFHEPFDNNINEWFVGDKDSDYSLSISGGYYYFAAYEDSNGPVSYSDADFFWGQETNFKIETSIKTITASDSCGFGLVWGYKDVNNFFEFLLASGGGFSIRKKENGIFENFIDTPSDLINKGNNGVNTISLERHGDLMQFFINAVEVHTIDFEPFLGGENRFYK